MLIILTPVASFTNKVNPRFAIRPLVFNGHLANRGLTSLVKEATVCGRVVQWTLYTVITRFYVFSRQVVFHDRKNKLHDFVKTVPDKLQNVCVFDKTTQVPLYNYSAWLFY